MRRFSFSSVIEHGLDADGPTLEVRALPTWGGYLCVNAKMVDSRVLRTSRHFAWPEIEWIGWLEPVRVEVTRAEGLATGLVLAASVLLRDPGFALPMAIGNGRNGAILRIAPHGGPWDIPGPNNPHAVALPFVTDLDQSHEIQDFLQRTAASAGVSFRRGQRGS